MTVKHIINKWYVYGAIILLCFAVLGCDTDCTEEEVMFYETEETQYTTTTYPITTCK